MSYCKQSSCEQVLQCWMVLWLRCFQFAHCWASFMSEHGSSRSSINATVEGSRGCGHLNLVAVLKLELRDIKKPEPMEDLYDCKIVN